MGSSSHHFSPPRKLRMEKIIPQVLDGVPALPPVTDTMKGVLDWMKLVKIHKYWPLFSRMSYAAIVGLSEDNIDEMLAVIGASPITSGARGHILRCTENLRGRVADVNNIDEYTAPCDVADIIQRIAESPLSSTEPETSGDFLLQLLRSKLDFLFEVHGSSFFAHWKIKKALECYMSRPEVPNDEKHIMNLQRNGSNDCAQFLSPADNISLLEKDFKTAASMEGTQEPHELPKSIARPEATRPTELRDIETRVVQPSACTSTGIPSSPFYSPFTKLQPAHLSSLLPSARVLSDTYSAEQSQCPIDCSWPKYQHLGLCLQFFSSTVNIPLLEKDFKTAASMEGTQEPHELPKSNARPEATRPTELRDIETRVVQPSACTSTGIPSSPFYSPFTKLQPPQLSSPLPSATYSAEQSQCPIDCSWPKYQHLGLPGLVWKDTNPKIQGSSDCAQFLSPADISLLEKDFKTAASIEGTQEPPELPKPIARPEATRPTELRDNETRVVQPSACTSTGIPSSPFYSPFTKLQPAQLSSPLPSATYSAEQSQCPTDCSWPKYQHLGLPGLVWKDTNLKIQGSSDCAQFLSPADISLLEKDFKTAASMEGTQEPHELPKSIARPEATRPTELRDNETRVVQPSACTSTGIPSSPFYSPFTKLQPAQLSSPLPSATYSAEQSQCPTDCSWPKYQHLGLPGLVWKDTNPKIQGSSDCAQFLSPADISLLEKDFKTAASMEGTQEPHELPKSIARPEATRPTELRDNETRVVQPPACTSTGIPSSPFYSPFTKLQPAQLSSPLPSATYSAEQSQCPIDCSWPKYQHLGLLMKTMKLSYDKEISTVDVNRTWGGGLNQVMFDLAVDLD